MASGSLRSAALHERALRALPGGNTRTTVYVPPRPPYAARGDGWRLIDEDGRELVDLAANYGALVHGHGHPQVMAAAQAALADGACFSLPTAHEVELAELLRRRVPAGERWRFAGSGTEAVMLAVRIARAATGRSGVLRFAGSYHGWHEAVLAADAPGVTAGVADDLVTVPVGDADALAAALDAHGERLACVVLDAMPNRAGLVPVSEAFAAQVRAETARRGILLLLDEVLTFRLAPGGLHATHPGLVPDLVALGKLIGGGFPVGAVGGRADVMAVCDPRRAGALAHGGTFAANPVTLRAGLAAVTLLDADAIARANALGERLRTGLAAQGWRVTGRGSLLRVHPEDMTDAWWRLYGAGVLVCGNGLACVSTVMDERVIERVLAAFASAAPTNRSGPCSD